MAVTIYTVEDLVRRLRVSRQTVRRYISKGHLTGRKVGKRYLVSEDSLRAFLGYPERKVS